MAKFIVWPFSGLGTGINFFDLDVGDIVGVELYFTSGGDARPFIFISIEPAGVADQEELFLCAEAKVGKFVLPIFCVSADVSIDTDGAALQIAGAGCVWRDDAKSRGGSSWNKVRCGCRRWGK